VCVVLVFLLLGVQFDPRVCDGDRLVSKNGMIVPSLLSSLGFRERTKTKRAGISSTRLDPHFDIRSVCLCLQKLGLIELESLTIVTQMLRIGSFRKLGALCFAKAGPN